jgi:hypothetical protein
VFQEYKTKNGLSKNKNRRILVPRVPNKERGFQ